MRTGRFEHALVAAALLAACGDGAPPPSSGPPPVPVTVATVEQRAMPVTVEAIGTVVAPETVEIRSRIGGELVGVHFREGQDVERGQLLFTIDSGPLEAALAEARARLARDRALAKKAQDDVARYRDLVAQDYVTREQFVAAEANAESLDATVQADEAAVKNAELQLGYTTIRSPLTGRTGNLLAHRGNMVKANDQTLVVIHQVEPIDVRFAVPQQNLPEVRRRSAAGALEVAAVPPGEAKHGEPTPSVPQQGKLTFVDNAIDPDTGTIELKATFANDGRALWPGQFVEVSLRLATEPDAVVVPARAVQTGQAGDYVFVVQDDRVESRPVRIDRHVGDRVVIADGLVSGETVVTDGQLRLVPGAAIVVKDQDASGDAKPEGADEPAASEPAASSTEAGS